ncbi:MAG: isochorismate synthase [Bacillota bacterium]
MRYQQKEIHLKNTLSFWENFKNEERILFYNPIEQKLIMGAKRIKTFASGESFHQYPYVFSSRTFFSEVKDEKWNGLGNETLAFAYYLVEKNGKQILYHAEKWFDIQDHKPVTKKHVYELLADDYQEWQEVFSNVKQEILLQNVNKVVISREAQIKCETAVDIPSVLRNLFEKNPNCFVFAYGKAGKTFLGASPEMLVQKEGKQIISYALAGTILRSEQEQDDQKKKTALLNDAKNRHEHQIVVDCIAHIMKKYGDEVIIGETTTMKLKNLYHLQSRIKATDNENSSLTDWAWRLHPTPAMGGFPVQKSLDIISRCEKHERGLYAAPIGMLNEHGDGVFIVGIRSALIEENRVYAYAGSGIVNNSECTEEYAETSNKLKTILESL